MKKLIFIKFGGSLITDKTKPNSVKLENIKNLSQQIREILDKDKNISLIIGTGAGSFGHYLVDKYHLQNGLKNEEHKLRLAEVQNGCATLNRIVVSALIQAGIPACTVNPSSVIMANNGQVNNFFIESILGFIHLGVIPVIYGDMVYDSKIGASVFSTEKQLIELVKKLKEVNLKLDKAIFCGTTDGVLNQDGKTIKQINRENFPTISKGFFKSEGTDVTGKMRQKVESCLQLTEFGVKSYIINGLTKNSLYETVIENKIKGWGSLVARKAK